MPGMDWLTNATGKYFSNNTLSRKARAMGQPQVRFRQFCKREGQYGKRSGQVLLFDKIGNASGTPRGGRIIGFGDPIPRGNFLITQGSCTAVPSGFAIPWMEEFETFSEFEVRDPISSRLSDDEAKAIDWRASNAFYAGNVIYTPTGATDSPAATWGTSGTAGGTASRDWQVWDLRNIVDALQYGVYGSSASAPVEPWDGVNYICIGSVPAMRALKDDPDWEKAQYYGDPEKLFSGETGRIYSTRCVANNNDNLGNSGKIGTTSYKGEAVIFGNDPVMEVVATMEEIREAIPGDFGRDMALAWYYLGGFAHIWSYNSSTEPDNRVVALGSL